jgi:hypothetical protein
VTKGEDVMFDTYKIIAIENENTVLINYGLNDGAKEGDVLRIIEPGEDLIIDGVNYGAYDGIKAVIEVTAPYARFAVCQRIVRRTNTLFSPVSVLQKTIARTVPLNVSKDDISTNLSAPVVTPIKIGDTVLLTRE